MAVTLEDLLDKIWFGRQNTLARIVTVSLETARIVDSLPALTLNVPPAAGSGHGDS